MWLLRRGNSPLCLVFDTARTLCATKERTEPMTSEPRSSSSSEESSEDEAPLSRAACLSLLRSAKLEYKHAKAALKSANALGRRAVKLRRLLNSEVSIAGMTPNTTARELKRKQNELSTLITHTAPARSRPACQCAACQTTRASERVQRAREAVEEAREEMEGLQRADGAGLVLQLKEPRALQRWEADVGALPAWEEVRSLAADAFPIKIIFLDKSGSMGSSGEAVPETSAHYHDCLHCPRPPWRSNVIPDASLAALALGAYHGARPDEPVAKLALFAWPELSLPRATWAVLLSTAGQVHRRLCQVAVWEALYRPGRSEARTSPSSSRPRERRSCPSRARATCRGACTYSSAAPRGSTSRRRRT